LHADDLRFTSEEAALLFNQAMGLHLSTEDGDALQMRTEGWIVRLQLAALALQGTSPMQGRSDVSRFISAFTGSQRFIMDCLGQKVLNRQPLAVQDFLLQTSILDPLTASLCDAITFERP
jgi:LuxR family maltose regulon positive regulatory protein